MQILHNGAPITDVTPGGAPAYVPGFEMVPAERSDAVQGLPGSTLQVQHDGVDIGNDRPEVINVVADPARLLVTRGTGEHSNVVTVRKLAVAPPPPPEPTILLIHGDGTDGASVFTDQSGYSRTITNIGTPTSYTALKKFGSASIFFNGGHALYIPPTPRLLNFYQYDFGVEFWFRCGNVAIESMASSASANNPFGWQIRYLIDRIALTISGADVIESAPASVSIGGDFRHVALTRVDGICSLWLDGALVGTHATSQVLDADGIYFGVESSSSSFGNYFHGLLDEIRVMQGVAPYTAPFTPATAAFDDLPAKTPFAENPNLATLALASHFDGADGLVYFRDVSGNDYAMSGFGAAQVDTSQSKFGGGSLLLTDNAFVSATITAINFATATVTAECWVRITSDAANFCPMCFGTNGDDMFVQMVSGVWSVGQSAGVLFTVAETVPLNTWTHIALVRGSGTTRLYRNGVLIGSSATTPVPSTATIVSIGGRGLPAIWTHGNLDEYMLDLREKYTANFTPATTDFIPRAVWPPSP